MGILSSTPCARREDLVFGQSDPEGQRVVKDRRSGRYYRLGAQECFLLGQLDGVQTWQQIRAAFEAEFDEPLSGDDLEQFLEMLQVRGLLAGAPLVSCNGDPGDKLTDARHAITPGSPHRQSLLYWRRSLCDPDRLLDWLEPKLRIFWTRGFLVVSALSIVAAALVLAVNFQDLRLQQRPILSWETAALAVLTIFIVTVLHELAHGLTCKHYGGEVHEVGFLLLFLLPCFYCNVSDAWLFQQKRKRLCVTFAGGYFEMFLWSLAVLAWRLTIESSLVHHLAWLVVVLCGTRILFNFNPLIKLDGYYLLSDALNLPNLRQQAVEHFMSRTRWLLWGAPRPPAPQRARFLLVYGLASWGCSLAVVALVLLFVGRHLQAQLGPLGMGLVVVVGAAAVRPLSQGLGANQAAVMLLRRHKRSAIWLAGLAGFGAVMAVPAVEDRAVGEFQLRAATRAEIRAPHAGFLREVYVEQGDRVSRQVIARLEVPELESRIVRKEAAVRKAEAELRLLEAGTRPEELAEQRARVQRARAWRDQARADLARQQVAFEEQVARLKMRVLQCAIERDQAHDELARSEALLAKNAVTEEQYQSNQAKHAVAQACYAQAEAELRALEALGVLEAEAEFARREKQWADQQGMLTLLEAGARPEQLELAEAQLAELREELAYLRDLSSRLEVNSPVEGIVVTPYMKEHIGRYFQEGELMCEVESDSALEVEVMLPEQEAAAVRPGQVVYLKARSRPFDIFPAEVVRIAPRAEPGQLQSTVAVYCRLTSAAAPPPTGMTGYARIYCGPTPIGKLLTKRLLRLLRTEFWW